MKTRMTNPFRHVARWFRPPVAARAVILLYHRVADLPSDPQLMAVTPRHFAEHLEVIRQSCRPLRLHDLGEALPDRSVVVTFDDGYADNLHHAKPLLAAHDVPATVFVTSGYVGSDREFWWDDLERILLETPSLPRRWLPCRSPSTTSVRDRAPRPRFGGRVRRR